MKIDSKTKNLIIVALGIVIAIVVYSMVYTKMKEKTEVLEAENATLLITKQAYEADDAQKEQNLQGINDLTVEREELLAEFPARVTREDEIMYWANMERANDGQLVMSNLVMSGWQEVPGGEKPVSEDGTTTSLALYKAPVNYSYQATYDGIKDMIEYVYAQKEEKKSIENFSVAYDASTGNLVGVIDINMYYMSGTDKEYKPTAIPSVPTGIANVFGATNSRVETDSESSVSDFVDTTEEAED